MSTLIFLFSFLSYFFVIFLRRLDPIFDEVAKEGGEGFEDLKEQANQGKQPFDHDTPLVHRYPFSDCMMMKYDGGKLVVNHHMMHTPTHDFTLFMNAMSKKTS